MARRAKPWCRQGRGWYVQHNGKQVSLGRDKKLAFKKFHELMSQPQRAKVPEPQAAKAFVSICDAFLDWTKRNRAEKTYIWYQQLLQSFVDYLTSVDASIPADKVKPFHVDRWHEVHDNWSATTRRASIIAVQRCFRWAEKKGYIAPSPMRSLEKPAAETRDRIISLQENEALLAETRDQEFLDVLRIAWEVGCRPQELIAVEARHVDLENSRWVFSPKESKGKKRPRIVYLTETALEITRRCAQAWPTGQIFRNTKGRPWTAYAINCRFIKLKRKLGTKYCLYNFRHTFATRKLESGIDALTVALLLGHANPAMLATTYQHLAHNPDHLLKQVRGATTA